MNLYIKVENGVPTGYPMLADNLKGILETSTLTDAIALAAGYYPFQNTNISDNVVVTGDTGFELCADGIVRKNITVRELTSAEKVDLWIKPARDSLLYKCDWTQATDSPLSTADKAAWAKYRQDLRDLPSKYPALDKASDIVWPTPPGELATVKPITP